ncbi:MAG: DeoR/GlpR family DNA-binding transcription regulator [Pseudomonadota bacterium]
MALSIRQRAIMKQARLEGQVQVDALATLFEVSPQTIRRDLGELCEARLLARVHGGAVLESGVANLVYETRRALAADAKTEIARLAAEEVPEGATLFLGIGTTTEAVARALGDRRDMLIVTNNLNVAHILSENESLQVILTGGRLRRADRGLVGEMAVDCVAGFRLDLAILGISAIDAEGALLDYDMAEIAVLRAMMNHARRRVLVADHTKFARAAPMRAASLTEFEVVVSDRALPPALARGMEQRGQRLLLPALEGADAAVEERAAAE